MQNIAICDNDTNDLEILYSLILRYSKQNEDFKFDIHKYSSSEELITDINKINFDLFFLDIIMPDKNGIEIGKIIRENKINAPIIYITSSREFAFDAWEIRAFNYIEKPLSMEDINRTFTEVHKYLLYRHDNDIVINTKNGIEKIDISQVMYIENVSRSCKYNLFGGDSIVGVCNRSSFEQAVSSIAQRSDFVHPHKSYFVNMSFISSLTSTEFILDNGVRIPISRNKYALAKRVYMKYLTRGEEN